MSGGHWGYNNDHLAQNIFGWNISCREMIGSKEYQEELKHIVRGNVLKDFELSMLVFDVLCLLHTYDYVYAGDYGDEELEQQVTAFKKKWLKTPRKTQIRETIDACIGCLKDDLYASFLIDMKQQE